MSESKQKSPEQLDSPVSAAEVCATFGAMAEELRNTGRAQRLGNHIAPYDGLLDITNRVEKQGRVTHVGLYREGTGNGSDPYSHEIHFPSVDSANKDYTVAKAIFVKHEFDENGDKTTSHSYTAEAIDPNNELVQEFIREIDAAYETALGSSYTEAA